jgi:hypothetical protein
MIRKLMTYHAWLPSVGWLYEPEVCLLPWTQGLQIIYRHLNKGRFVGMFGVSIT